MFAATAAACPSRRWSERLRRALGDDRSRRNGMPQPTRHKRSPSDGTLITNSPPPMATFFPTIYHLTRQPHWQTYLGRRNWHSRIACSFCRRRTILQPEFALYSKDGKPGFVEPLIDPDIVVDTIPGKEFKAKINNSIAPSRNADG